MFGSTPHAHECPAKVVVCRASAAGQGGCSAKVCLADLPDHLAKECPATLVVCPVAGCAYRMERRDLPGHEAAATRRHQDLKEVALEIKDTKLVNDTDGSATESWIQTLKPAFELLQRLVLIDDNHVWLSRTEQPMGQEMQVTWEPVGSGRTPALRPFACLEGRCVAKGFLYATGGITGINENVEPSISRAAYRLELCGGSRGWQTLSPMRHRRAHHTLIAGPHGCLYAIGGVEARQSPSSSVEIYDPRTDRWTEGVPLTYARTGHTVTRLDGGLLVAGGRPNHPAEFFDFKRDQWFTGASWEESSRSLLVPAGVGEVVHMNLFPFRQQRLRVSEDIRRPVVVRESHVAATPTSASSSSSAAASASASTSTSTSALDSSAASLALALGTPGPTALPSAFMDMLHVLMSSGTPATRLDPRLADSKQAREESQSQKRDRAVGYDVSVPYASMLYCTWGPWVVCLALDQDVRLVSFVNHTRLVVPCAAAKVVVPQAPRRCTCSGQILVC